MSVDRLAPMIHQILSAPDTDLSTVSAKRVRKQLVELDPDVTLEFVKQNKDAIDALIGSIFESLNNPNTSAGFRAEPSHVSVNGNGNGKRKREDTDRDTIFKSEGNETQGEDDRATGEDEEEPGSPSPTTPAAKKARKASTRALTDEEYAKQLSSELNQRPSRGSRKVNGSSKKGASRTPKKKKSRAQIEDSDDEDEDAAGSSRNKKARKKSGGGSAGGDAKGGFAKEYSLRSVAHALLLIATVLIPIQVNLWQSSSMRRSYHVHRLSKNSGNILNLMIFKILKTEGRYFATTL
jgi:upstream activation factor subunit UAF30